MNVINQLGSLSRQVTVFQVSKRYARKIKWKTWKNDWLPFEWVRPEAKQGYFDTGDRIEKIEKYDNNLMPLAHQDAIKEIGDVPKEIQNMLTYEFYRRRDNANEFREQKVLDASNNEMREATLVGVITNLTYKIRKGRAILRESPNDVGSKKFVNNMKGKRLKYMIQLYKFDKDAYQKLLKDLEIDTPRMMMGGQIPKRIERKKELRRLTKEYCDNICDKKMKNYHDQLKEQQKQFEIEKIEFEEWMAKTMIEMNISEDEVKID